jgi:hypothetical protein
MHRNIGTIDKIIRSLAALGITILLLTGVASGLAATILGIVAVAFLVTSSVSFCPVYVPFRISTRKPTNRSTQ